jgi:deoxyribodipyrimidine photo-lyase
MQRPRVRNRRIHQRLRRTHVLTRRRHILTRRPIRRLRHHSAEPRKQINPLQFNVAGQYLQRRKLRRAQHRVADHRARLVWKPLSSPRNRQRDARIRVLQVMFIRRNRMVFPRVRQNVRPGQHPWKRFQKGGSAHQRECRGVRHRGAPQRYSFHGCFDPVKVHATLMVADSPVCDSVGGAMENITESTPVLDKDAAYARIAAAFAADEQVPRALRDLADDPRITVRRGGAPAPRGKCVVYWMQRAQRGRDNAALDTAIAAGNALGLPVVAYFAAIKNFPHANLRHYAFLNQGLPDVEEDCAERGVGFVMRRFPREDHLKFFADVDVAMVVGDENPMREPERWRVRLANALRVPFWTVDADVIVPSKLLEKAQFSAAVARPRLYRALPDFLVPYTNPRAATPWTNPPNLHAEDLRADLTRGWTDFDRSVAPLDAWTGGHHAALTRLHQFCDELLQTYDKDRNRPEVDGTSKMSPFLHYGHIGPQTIALAVAAAAKKNRKLRPAQENYFNELIVWRELSVNFVRYQPEYDSPGCADSWAKDTIAEHDRDEREVLYTLPQLEAAHTHDELWNAAQIQMVRYGWMHNHLRMYWAKKIIEWTPNVTIAMKVAIYLNDKYFLDGRDPNGYSGIAWSMLGKFDRVWFDRPIFGKRRYMSAASTGRKFMSALYIQQMKALPEQPPPQP